ncbi:ribosomal protein L7/L12 [Dethiothermospora halolimnae]|uniref:ribosomal protein L7/L12 n=1 Tax=Dethiothermospora halolimnae TaxID=3114390 RepID=UPI003CCBF5C7
MEYIYIGLGLLILACLILVISQLRNSLVRINITLDKIARQMGVLDEVDDKIKDLVSEGKKIEAVKRYRKITGAGLKEANDYVDKLIAKELND